MNLLIVITVILLAGIAYQDFKYRGVYWWIFPLLTLALFSCSVHQMDWTLVLKQAGWNLVFVGVQLLFLTVYFSMKQGRWVNILENYFGLGDLFFLICIAFYFQFSAYLLFYVSSLFLTILLSLLISWSSPASKNKIPLAGYQSVMLLLLIAAGLFIPDLNVVSNLWTDHFLTL